VNQLATLGCGYGQGFLFARGLDRIAAEEFVAARQVGSG
jgi:EAL domain-containing protein (putative c-di-GMP-specific phosphodiesterase class I)